MKEADNLLWNKIKTFELDDPTAPLTFTDRLARENGWSMEYSLKTVCEYKKFMFLLCLAPHPLTPSDQVDQVWHLHLLYTYSYWTLFCQHTIKRAIHHGPTKGGSLEKEQYLDWYIKTKAFYQDIFEQAPPEDIWPSAEKRFKERHFQRVNLSQYWLVKKPQFFNP
ncbi:hypothetical protein Q0590_05525 [Rhodocytophaga aerolata]|uniref:Uncharacterized protein n=1 Tax=Rhodocytophaga aerolata TaxID=455078 RepID=A0ABT8R0T8_9BACT|nr:hypothetical protein [Rhodocytophaga aerolata]MDO1445698.1 hypothetical protein [Rhodocytophaga aerolata]